MVLDVRYGNDDTWYAGTKCSPLEGQLIDMNITIAGRQYYVRIHFFGKKILS
jgi:hypothetical protein